MDASRFDSLARSLTSSRTRRAVAALFGAGLAAPLLGSDDADAKKKKKKRKHKKKTTCAQTCSGGCCTSEHGACIQPTQQSNGLCGTGGEICRSTGCVGTCPSCACSASAPCPAGQCCRGDGTCGACLVFVSSSGQNGNMGGLPGADGRCQNLANLAQLPGAYKAWLSDSTGSPATRFTQASAPYTLVDGTVVAQNWADLTSGTLQHAIDMKEDGQQVTDPQIFVWTGTGADGAETAGSPKTCVNWTSAAGNPTQGDVGRLTLATLGWTGGGTFGRCSSNLRLYCFQQQ